MRFSRDRFGDLAASVFVLILILLASPPVAAQDRVPRLEPAECPLEQADWARDVKFECKWLVVPEARGKPKGRTIKLAVLILRAKEPDGTPPLVLLHGGPGDSGIRNFTRGTVEAKVYEHRDIVIYDQRSAGFSEPKLCPEFKDVERESLKVKTQSEIEELVQAGIRKCVASLDTRIERSAYNTGESAADMIDLRRTLGYASWDVYSTSYGGRLAQEAMRRDPKGIRSMVLERPVTRGPTREAEAPLSNQRAFERVFTDCNEQPECRAAFPTLEKDFYEVYDDLNRTPLSVQVDQNPNERRVVLDGERFLQRIRNDMIALGIPERLSNVPLLINEFRRGDKTRAAKILFGSDPWAVIGGNTVLLRLMSCYDSYGKQLRAERKAINSQVRAPFRRDLTEECKLWQKRFAEASEWEPVRSDIPTLILTGRYDDRTPTEHAKRIASTLTRAYLYEFPNEAHRAPPRGCHAQILRQFWANPFREPDASCIKTIPPIRFITSWQASSGGP
jgi:pimeloyl-ACP methyl ester carboxylesterase